MYKITDLHKHLFWDVDINRLDWEKDKTFIIQRVFCRGHWEDLKIIFKVYGYETIKKEIVNVGYLDKKTLNFASTLFDIPKNQFKCYTKIQSQQGHWNY